MTSQPLPPEKPRKKKFSRRFQILIGLVIVLALAYSGAWLFGAQTIRTQIEMALANALSPEGSANCSDLAIGGFPFRYDATCSGLAVTEGDIAIAVPEIKATVLVYRPTHVLWFAQGPANYADAFTGTEQQISWDELRGSARSNGWALARISIEGSGLILTDTLLEEREIGRIATVEIHAIDSEEKHDPATGLTEIALYAGIEGADMDDLTVSGGSLRLEAEVPSVPDDIRQWTLANLARNWQLDPVRLVGLHAEDTTSSVDVVGTIGTTADAHLNGDFDLTTSNIYEPLSAMIAPQMLDIFLGQKSDDGSYYRSYALRDGVLLAGNLPVMTVPPLL